MAKIELPPILKKLSVIPTLSNPRTDCQTLHIDCSVSVVGATYSSNELKSGSGKACLFNLPLTVSGNASNCTKAPGTIYSGSVLDSSCKMPAWVGVSEPLFGT